MTQYNAKIINTFRTTNDFNHIIHQPRSFYEEIFMTNVNI